MSARFNFVLFRVAAVVVIPGLVVAAQSSALAGPKPKTPTPVIGSGPTGYVDSRAATFTVTDSRSDAVMSCSLDGATFRSCTSPVSYTGLSEAAHTFRVHATSPGLRVSGNATRTWTVDVTPPSAPTVSQPATATSSPTNTITFSSSALDVTGYQCALDGATVPSACTSPSSVDPGSDGWHSYAVSAVDHAGNVGAPASVRWYRDTTTPVPLVNGGPADPTTATSATFAFASSEPGVTFSCSLDAAAWSGCSSGATFGSLAVGTHSFQVRATDGLGNTADSSVYAWHVVPVQSVDLAWSGATPAANTKDRAATLAFTAAGATTVDCSLDGIAQSCAAGTPIQLSALADGAHTYTVVADQGLASQATLSYTWTVDTVAPAAPYVLAPSGVVASSSASVTVLPSALGDVLTCEVDAAPIACGSPVSLTGLADGTHAFAAVESDAAGNQSTTSVAWRVDTTPPVVAMTVPTTLIAPVRLLFTEPVHGVSATSVVLKTAAGTVVAAKLACRTLSGGAASCTGNWVRRVVLTPTAALVPGEHYVASVNANAGRVIDLVGNAAAASTAAFRGALAQQETSPAAHATWRRVTAASALGGSYLVERRAGASVTWSFTGTSLTWYTMTGPSYGRAAVYIDGTWKTSVNNYAASAHARVARTVTGLRAGAHRLVIRVAGVKGSTKGKDTLVAVDGFRVGATTWATPSVTASWQSVPTSGASGGHYVRDNLAGASLSFAFRGTGVTWLTATGPTMGRAAVYVDGTLVRTVDGYAAATHYRVGRSLTGLADKRHVVKVVVLGTRAARSKGTDVVVDGWTVR